MKFSVTLKINQQNSFMKKLFALPSIFVLIGLFTFLSTSAQQANRPSPGASASGKIGDATINVSYSSPAVKERTVWGDLVPYGKVWRAGANEATTIEVNKDVMVQGQTLPAGKYSLFLIPTEKDWTVVFNKVADQWGAYNYKESDDVLRVIATPGKSKTMNERLVYQVNGKGVVFAWENIELPIAITKK